MIASVTLFVVCLLFYFWFTPQWVPEKALQGPSPQLVPNICTIGIAICCVFIFFSERLQPEKEKPEQDCSAPSDSAEENFFEQLAKEDETVDIDLRGLGYCLAAVFSCVFYVLVVNSLGFIITMAIITPGLMLLYGQRKPWIVLLTTAIMSIGVYFFFTGLLKMVLPPIPFF